MKTFQGRLFSALAAALILAAMTLAASAPTAQAAERVEHAPPAVAPAWFPPFACSFIVRPGDDVFRIALRFHVSPFALTVANGLTRFTLIFAGTALRVPCVFQPTPPVSLRICDIHIVQRGEWLELIADRFGVSLRSLIVINGLRNPNLIFPGMRLLIPCAGMPSPLVRRTLPVFPMMMPGFTPMMMPSFMPSMMAR